MMTDVILIDLLKAFDIIDHGLVLQKLYIIGFSNYTVNWFKSDLSSKSFLVNFIFSQPALGCNPRVYFGPLLFSIYPNEMSQAGT